MSALPYALAAVQRGWWVFPVWPNKKTPAVEKWGELATNDAAQVSQWFADRPNLNYGIAAKHSGLVIVDCDTPKPGFTWPEEWADPDVHDGNDVLMLLAFNKGDTSFRYLETFTVVTPSGGTHHYYRKRDAGVEVTNSAGKIAPLVDIRAAGGEWGGYVVGPGSVIDGRPYRVTNKAETLGLPPWLHDAATAQPVRATPPPGAPSSGSSSVAAFLGSGQGRIAGALEFLSGKGSEVQRQGQAVFWVACVFAAEGRPQSEAFASIWPIVQGFYLSRPNEPWLPIHVQKTIQSAYSQPRE